MPLGATRDHSGVTLASILCRTLLSRAETLRTRVTPDHRPKREGEQLTRSIITLASQLARWKVQLVEARALEPTNRILTRGYRHLSENRNGLCLHCA